MKLTKKQLVYGIIIFFIVLGGAFLIFFTKKHMDKQKEKITVPISMALDDGYLYPTIVSITSMMESKKETTTYDFYIMHPAEFSDESKKKLNSLGDKFKQCNIKLINMGDKYKNANDRGHITTPAYYRLSLSDIVSDLDKILWIDGDTLAFDDLSGMYKTDVTGLYYRGVLDDTAYSIQNFDVDNDHCICDGVMVVNLAELRKDNMVQKYSDFIEKNNDKLNQHDQTVINVLCADKIGKLDPRYGIFNYYCPEKEQKNFFNNLRAKDKYTLQEIKEAVQNLSLVHCVIKPWKNKNASFFNEWWETAKRTDFYEEIKNKYADILNS